MITTSEPSNKLYPFLGEWKTLPEITNILDLYNLDDIQTFVVDEIIEDDLHMDLLDYMLSRIYKLKLNNQTTQ